MTLGNSAVLLTSLATFFDHAINVFFLFCFSVLSQTGLSKYPGLKDTLLEMYSNGIDSPYLMSALINIYEEELESGLADSNCLDQALEVSWILMAKEEVLH